MTKTDGLMGTTHVLSGLEPDNLLAFLALLGLLKALERARPEWKPRVFWEGKPPRAVLVLSAGNIICDQLVEGIEEGICGLGKSYEFDRPNITFTRQEFRLVVRSAQGDREKTALYAALASDGALKRDKDVVEPAPLCAMFGQGHQDFLSRLESNAKRCNLGNFRDIQKALFEPWKYDDDAESFRWDPVEDRRYAHQFGDPSETKNKIGSVTGANRLAAIGFSVLTCVPTTSGLTTSGVAGRRRKQNVCWPIVAAPTSLAGHLALLAHPVIGEEEKASRLAAYGVAGVARSRRFQVGKYFNFERARVQFL